MTRTILPERNLDVLRAIAVLVVLANHIANALIGHATVLAGWVGQAGVQAFFVHTSLVLMGSMEKDNAPNRDGWIKRFYIRRAWRIYPLAIAVVAVVLLLHVPSRAVRGPRESFSLGDIAANIGLVQNLFDKRYILGVLWTREASLPRCAQGLILAQDQRAPLALDLARFGERRPASLPSSEISSQGLRRMAGSQSE